MNRYGHFEERGYRVEVDQPDSGADPTAFELRVLIDGVIRASLAVPMTYRPVFGVGWGDHELLEVVSNELMEEEAPPEKFNEETSMKLLSIARRYGGDGWEEFRQRHDCNSQR